MYAWTLGIKDLASSKLENITGRMRSTNSVAETLRGNLAGVGNVAIGAVVATSVSELGRSVVDTLSQFEKYEAVLTNTLGSNSAAQGILNGITEFAKRTPYEVSEVTGAFVKMANQGFAPNLAELTKLGDLASSVGKSYDNLAEAIVDAQVGEFERLKEFGIQAAKANGMVTFSFKNQKITVAENAAAIRGYFTTIGAMNGVAGSMAAISATTGGQISNMRDQVTALYLEIGTALKPVIADTLGYFTKGLTVAATWVKENRAAIGQWLTTFGEVAKAVGVAYVAFNVAKAAVTAYSVASFIATNATNVLAAANFALNYVLYANPVGLVIGVIATLAGGLYYAYQKSETFRAGLTAAWRVLEVFGGYVYDFAVRPLMALGEILLGVFTGDGDLIRKGMSDAADAIRANAQNMLNAGTEIGKAFTEGWNQGTAGFRADNLSVAATAPKDDPFKNFKSGSAFDFAKQRVGGSVSGKNDSLGIGKVNKAEGGGGQIKNINIRIDKLVEKIENHFDNSSKFDDRKIREAVVNALVAGVNDFNYQ